MSARFTISALALTGFILLAFIKSTQGEGEAPEKKFEDFDKVVKGAKEHEGLFRLHQKEDKLYAEIRPDQMEKNFLLPIAIARGAGMGGHTLNFDNQWVVSFKRVGDKVHLIRRNVRFTARPGTPTAKAVETTYTDSVLLALRIVSINPGRQSILVSFNDIFMSDFAQLGMGMFDPSRSTWFKVKAFPRNVELEIAATYTGGRGGRGFHGGGDDSVIDSRGETVVIHYGLSSLSDSGYQSRMADDRVGHFLTAVKDFSSENTDTTFRRYINRWRLERADPVDPKNPNKLSPPRKKIVFWIEKSVPDEYRSAVREGILEWNKAFEKIGFRDAIEVRQQENEEFDPEDINYNTFRWIASDQGFAMGPSRANPLTGEILDADIIFDASMVRFWRQESKLYSPGSEPASSIQEARRGLHFLNIPALPGLNREWNAKDVDGRPEGARKAAIELAGQHGLCQCSSHMKHELSLAAMAAMDRNLLKPGEKIPEELLSQAIKEVTMHEVGHTLGLRHNFKASTFLKNDQLHDTTITRKTGLVGSVMDYAPTNLAPKGKKQGDYYTTTLGPYDYWAIEYAYKPLSGGTEGEVEKLHEIAKLAPKAGYDYATDEDMMTSSDPLVNVWDLGSDPLQYARDRVQISRDLFNTLADKAVDNGEGYQRVRTAFLVLLNQYGNAAALATNFVGGEYMHRDHKGDPDGRDPFIPVAAARQREALKFIQDNILADTAFQFPPELLRKLASDRWMHWGNERVMTSVDFPLYQRVLAIQNVALAQLLDNATLSRIQNNQSKTKANEQSLSVAEVFRSLTDGIWTELQAEVKKQGKKDLKFSSVRRNLQRSHISSLAQLALATGGLPDARSLARMHLKQIQSIITVMLADKEATLDDATRAHLDDAQERIQKVLSASILTRD